MIYGYHGPGRTGHSWFAGSQMGPHRFPRLDLYRSDDGYRLVVDLPGVGDDDVEVFCDEGGVTVEGTFKDTRDFGHPLSIERPVGDFSRRLPLPPEVDADAVTAQFDRGLLLIDLPTGGDLASRKVKVGKRRRKGSDTTE